MHVIRKINKADGHRQRQALDLNDISLLCTSVVCIWCLLNSDSMDKKQDKIKERGPNSMSYNTGRGQRKSIRMLSHVAVME